MRLWHYKLIPYLPRQQLLGQHRECCALRGKGWGKKHSVVNYVFKYPYSRLFEYHWLVMNELMKRGYYLTPFWFNSCYRGKILGNDLSDFTRYLGDKGNYPEHNEEYLQECLKNLEGKGIKILIK